MSDTFIKWPEQDDPPELSPEDELQLQDQDNVNTVLHDADSAGHTGTGA